MSWNQKESSADRLKLKVRQAYIYIYIKDMYNIFFGYILMPY